MQAAALNQLKVVVNAGNGGAGLIVDALEPHLPFEFIKVNHKPDGSFPHGVPNPMLEENRAATAQAVLRAGADVGLAWDGDYDRCFFFDESGTFIEGYYLVGLLAERFLQARAGRAHRARPAPDLEHPRHRAALRRRAGAVQIRARVHQAEDARGRCRLWR